MTADGTYRPSTRVTTAAELDALLNDLNDSGHHPVVLLVDGAGVPGLAYLAEHGGDEAEARVLIDGWSEGDDHDQPLDARHYPVTVLFRPDAPQPATTDDAVERAASRCAVCDRDPRTGGEHWYEHAPVRATLAAAGAEETVDREAVLAAIGGVSVDFLRGYEEERETQEHRHGHAADRVMRLLAARGDAAPTEVEWGVRYTTPKGDQKITRTDRQDDAEHGAAVTGGDVMQRTVSAWREMTP